MAVGPDLVSPGGSAALAALVGAVLGSFIATLVIRWPKDASVLRGRSRCDSCGTTVRARDLVPLLSAVLLRGKCRTCGAAIDPLHWQVEGAGALIGMAALILLPGPAGWLLALFGWMVLPLVLLDARLMWLPDPLVALLAVTGMMLGGGLIGASLADRLIGAIAGGLVLAAIGWGYRHMRGRDGMGGGDPKLVAAIGAWLGWQMLPVTLLIASGGGIVWALLSHRKGDRSLGQRPVPFGVFLGIAAWAAVPIWPLISGR